jgi:hypothetical protein
MKVQDPSTRYPQLGEKVTSLEKKRQQPFLELGEYKTFT